MSYSSKSLSKATQILSERRAKAQKFREERHDEIIKLIPDVAKYEAQLSSSGLAVIKAFGMGNDAQKYIDDLSRVNLTIQKAIGDLLESKGYPRDYLLTPYTCQKCEDTGFVNGYFCECRKEILKEISKEELSSVSPSRECRFDNFELNYYPLPVDSRIGVSPRNRMGEILNYCKAYAEDFDEESGSLYFYGATGLGKTHLSLAIANAVTEKGYNVIYDSSQNILTSLEREKFGGLSAGKREKELLDCDLLIIDDLGSEFSTQFTVAAIYNIINTRINTSKPVIISTNLNEKELEEKYTQRIASRIIGNYVSILFLGNDIRQLKKNR